MKLIRYSRVNRSKLLFAVLSLFSFMWFSGCAPHVTQMTPLAGQPGSIVSLLMVNLVGWPRVEIGSEMMDWPKLKLLSADPAKKDVRGEDLVWIEDKILQFRIPDLKPGDYTVTIHDDKGLPRRSHLLVLRNYRLFGVSTGVALRAALEPGRSEAARAACAMITVSRATEKLIAG